MNKKQKTKNKKDIMKTVCGVCATVLICTTIFNTLSEAAIAAELNKKEAITTTYHIPGADSTQKTGLDNYKKADYTVVSDPLEYYKDKQPTAKDLTQDQAAEIGAQLLWKLFGVDLDGATIYMGYDPGTETFPRAFWGGDVRFGSQREPGDLSYSFMIDAVTGESFNASWGRTLDVTVSLDLDLALADNPKEFLELAEKKAEELDLVHGKVASASYNCQGYANNDPAISIDIIGVNGERALLTFSRYDKELTGISYNTSIEISEKAHEAFMKDLEEKINNLRQNTNNNNNSPELQAIP